MNTPSPRRRRTPAQPAWQWTDRARALLRDASAHPEAGQEQLTNVTWLPGRDTTADAADPATAGREAHPAARPPDPDPPFHDRPFLDPAVLDPSEIAPLDTEWPEPEWPDPSWHGFAPGAQDRCTFVLAVSPLLLERYPDKAASLWQVFPSGAERYHDPEPDLEAEP